MMQEHEQVTHERDEVAEYTIEAFLDSANEDEIRRFQHRTDRGPFGGSSGGAAVSEVLL